MHELDLPRAYRTIFVCDSFGLGGLRAHDAEALRRCHAHLAPGGALVLNIYPPYGDAAVWPSWRPERRLGLPEAWPETGDRRRLGDGDELELRARMLDLDPLEQRLTRQINARLWRAGALVAEEERSLLENLYFRNELLLMLDQAGFADIAVLGGYAGEPATPESAMLVSSPESRPDAESRREDRARIVAAVASNSPREGDADQSASIRKVSPANRGKAWRRPRTPPGASPRRRSRPGWSPRTVAPTPPTSPPAASRP
jgi:hypothetical protein